MRKDRDKNVSPLDILNQLQISQIEPSTAKTFEERRNEIDLNIHEEGLNQQKAERQLRDKYCGRIFIFIIFYTVIVLFMVIFSGIKAIEFELSQPILITLLTTTLANVFGLFLIVLNYLFPKRDKKEFY